MNKIPCHQFLCAGCVLLLSSVLLALPCVLVCDSVCLLLKIPRGGRKDPE